MSPHDCLLHVEGLEKYFGGLKAVSDYSLSLRKGELVGLIGPNGAGKTTVFNLLTGIIKPSSGRVMLNNEDITGYPPHLCAIKGMARTFQNIRVFESLSVIDNIKIAFHMHHGKGFVQTVLRLPGFKKSEKYMSEKAEEFIELMRLEEVRNTPAKNLAYGQQRRLEIARGLAADPQLLLLDEPAAGMNPKETKELTEIINHIHREMKITILMIEHDMRLIMSISKRIQVLNQGCLLAMGSPGEIQSNPEVIKAYLGESGDCAHA